MHLEISSAKHRSFSSGLAVFMYAALCGHYLVRTWCIIDDELLWTKFVILCLSTWAFGVGMVRHTGLLPALTVWSLSTPTNDVYFDTTLALQLTRMIRSLWLPAMSWWRHQTETFSALLALCGENPLVTGGFPHKGQLRGALMFSLICAWTNGRANNRDAGDLRHHCAHYEVTAIVSDKQDKLCELIMECYATSQRVQFEYKREITFYGLRSLGTTIPHNQWYAATLCEITYLVD